MGTPNLAQALIERISTLTAEYLQLGLVELKEARFILDEVCRGNLNPAQKRFQDRIKQANTTERRNG